MGLIVGWLEAIGDYALLLWNSILATREIHRSFGEVVRQIAAIGYGSLTIVMGSSTFVGLVSGVLISYQIKDYVPADLIGLGIWKGVSTELAPVLTALVVAGRVGGGLASEIGTMRVTEQIDALEVMGINPYRFIVLPRIIAGIISIPLLTIVATFIAVLAALFLTVYIYGLPSNPLINGIKASFVPKDLIVGGTKAFVFGGIITTVSCYFGYYTKGGAVGVGRSAMNAVVASAVLILAADFLISMYFYS
ncbi:MAG: ABC transporter permease [Thermotogae bacterium]|nr:ABC transporter permease [Thermotogota bacterium]